jgi:tRNA threonylcarbamoyl adenosine modification protein YjeE
MTNAAQSSETPAFSFSLAVASEEAIARLMADLALLLMPGDTIALSGGLGAGKTTCARALIRQLAGDPVLDVPSPTFTLIQSYDLPQFTLLHADLYRITSPREIDELDLFDNDPRNVRLIEWPEHAGNALPHDRIDIALSHHTGQAPSRRDVTLTGTGLGAARVERLSALLRFLNQTEFADAQRTRLAGDASSRSYARMTLPGTGIVPDSTALLMNSPRRPDGPPVYRGKSYSEVVHLAEDIAPFVAIAGGLRDHGFSAPAILHADFTAGFILLEDLGLELFVEGNPPAPIFERYKAAVEMLAALHHDDLPDHLPVTRGVTYTLPEYDIDAFLTETSLLLDWHIPESGRQIGEVARAEFDSLWRAALAPVLTARKTWVLRDFHSPNLIWLPQRPDTARVGLIDFQDALMGPEAYDVASLLQDARVDVSEEMEITLLTHYVKERLIRDPDFDARSFASAYTVMATQRATKILGIFARLNRRDGKPAYLRHQPRVWTYLQRALAHPALNNLRGWYALYVQPPKM